MNEKIGCGILILIVIFGILLGIAAILDAFGVWNVIITLASAIVGVIAIVALFRKAQTRRERLRFLREAPSQIQDRMGNARDNFAVCAAHLETAKGELEAATAPLFWDAMDDFVPAIMQCRDAWNAAVDIAQRYEEISARMPQFETDGAAKPDASIPRTVREMLENWMSLRRLALSNEHFASIFEQRRQADKITERLKQQGEEVQAAINAAERAEQTALHAAVVAEKAAVTSKQAVAKARKAGATARQAGAEARRAGTTARHAGAEAEQAVSIARWSKI